MRTRLLAALCVLGLLGACCALSLSGRGGPTPIFQDIPLNLDNYVDLPDLHVSVHTPPEVYVNRPFTVTATIASQYPLTSLSGSGEDLGLPGPFQAERLDDILSPPASPGSYALCLIVDLHFDDDSAFDLHKYSTPFTTEQEFTLVPDVTTAQTVQWTVTPGDTLGAKTVAHEAKIRVWFDAETTCKVGTPSLLGDWFYLVSSSPNVALSTKFTVVNDELGQERAIMAHLQPLAVAAVAAGTTASVVWAAGVFEWVLMPLRRLRRRGARRKHGTQGASEQRIQQGIQQGIPRSAAQRSWVSLVVRGGALLSSGLVLITLGPSALVYILGANLTLVSFFGGIVMACGGIVFLALGVRRIRVASSA